MGLYSKWDKRSEVKSTSTSIVDITSKDGRTFRFKFNSRELEKIQQTLLVYTFPDRLENFFAYDYFKHMKHIEERYHGWKTYDIIREFKRQGVLAQPLKSIQSNGTMEISVKFTLSSRSK